MKKYVRTKKRVGERLEPSEDCPEVEDEHWLGLTYGLIHKDTEPVIAESDDLEELCDEFTYEFINGGNEKFEHQRCYRNSTTGIWYDYYDDFPLTEKEISTIRGGIWTDKAFIYVAKMGDKGKLECDI